MFTVEAELRECHEEALATFWWPDWRLDCCLLARRHHRRIKRASWGDNEDGQGKEATDISQILIYYAVSQLLCVLGSSGSMEGSLLSSFAYLIILLRRTITSPVRIELTAIRCWESFYSPKCGFELRFLAHLGMETVYGNYYHIQKEKVQKRKGGFLNKFPFPALFMQKLNISSVGKSSHNGNLIESLIISAVSIYLVLAHSPSSPKI